MKKRLFAIISLVTALIMCFSLVACGNGHSPKQEDEPKTVSISVNDVIGLANGVLDAKGFSGSASYTLSTKNTGVKMDTVSIDKRGDKIKIVAGEEEIITDVATGYVYVKGDNGYAFEHMFTAGNIEYVQHLLSLLPDEIKNNKIDATYDGNARSVSFTVDMTDNANKYVEPLQTAYKEEKLIGEVVDQYCELLFERSFYDIYAEIEDYIADPDNTVGTALEKLKEYDIDVEAMLESAGLSLPDDQMAVIKARPLNKVVAGAYKYLMNAFGSLLPRSVDSVLPLADTSDGSAGEDAGMNTFVSGLLNAMLFDEISDKEVAVGMQGIGNLVTIALESFNVKAVVDMAFTGDSANSDLYIMIKDEVKFKELSAFVTLDLDDKNNVAGITVECIASHTYSGEAADGSYLADNDYRATAQLLITEYNTQSSDFDIEIDRNEYRNHSVAQVVYDFGGSDVSVYYETAGTDVKIDDFDIVVRTPDGDQTAQENIPDGAFDFDSQTSSFVFDGAFVSSALNGAAAGTYLTARVVFEGEEDAAYYVTLVYLNDDLQEVSDYLIDYLGDMIKSFIGR